MLRVKLYRNITEIMSCLLNNLVTELSKNYLSALLVTLLTPALGID